MSDFSSIYATDTRHMHNDVAVGTRIIEKKAFDCDMAVEKLVGSA